MESGWGFTYLQGRGLRLRGPMRTGGMTSSTYRGGASGRADQ